MIQAHVFANEQDADAAMALINTGEGIPVNESAVTSSYTTAYPCDEGWFIRADAVTIQYLGAPIDFEPPQFSTDN